MSSRNKKLILNMITMFIVEIVLMINGFIIPRFILEAFGSEVNGLVSSVTQFLGVISLLDLGVGAVVESALYKPIADKDNESISSIYVAADKFFKRIALILVCYIIILIFLYPFIIDKKFDWAYIAFLITAIGISNFSQYYFGIVNCLVLSADQRGYIQNAVQIITVILNTIVSIILIKTGSSIQTVKLATSLIFLIRPLFLNWYVKKNYCINYKIAYSGEPIKNKWYGMAQHFAHYVLNETDNIVLTFFSTLKNVSIYSVYSLVVNGVSMFIDSLSAGLSPYFGNLWVKNEKGVLQNNFMFFEWLIHSASVLVFGCTGVLIVDFVKVYTFDINDTNYAQPLFAVLISLAFLARSLRLPYHCLILAVGHYKQTKNSYIYAMLINIIISVIVVKKFGLIGVAVGTLAAMMYQTSWQALYSYKNLIYISKLNLLKQYIIDLCILLIGYVCTYGIGMQSVDFLSWIWKACIVLIIWLAISIVINAIFYKSEIVRLWSFISKVHSKHN